MVNLDDTNKIGELDKGNVALSIEKLPDQIEHSFKESSQTNFSESYKQIKNIIIIGMGGSGLGPEMIYYLCKDTSLYPFTIVHDYDLPKFANQDTLAVLSSYSGTTEEVLEVANSALARGCKITGITEGGYLAEFFKKSNLTSYIFKPEFNPSEQPRFGLGYSVGGILGLLKSLGVVEVSESEVNEVLFCLRELNPKLSVKSPLSENFAKELSTKLHSSSVGVVAAEFLSANAHIFANQLNETAKNFSFCFLLPELNHHLLEGLAHPENLGEITKFIFLASDLYSEKVVKRVRITRDIMDKQKIETLTVKLEGSTKLSQAFEAILVSSWTSFYLAMLNEVDPSTIPWVDFFKEELAKQS